MIQRIKRGEIYWANFSDTRVSKDKKIRPVVILQNDIGNQKLKTTIVVPATTQLQYANPVIVQISKNLCGLKEDSYFLFSDIITVPKDILLEKIGDVTLSVMDEMKKAINLSLGLEDISANPFYKYI
ncbi:MAG: type II toxin-antitoxin system PemK/MazF family toxin [Candidatus Omnitrophica bacterium]|nr:type II toxin-antitoxin system PemK/MazF family toxin [Candidatus Omnitrophota bacterium]